jgi:hypothetical protein
MAATPSLAPGIRRLAAAAILAAAACAGPRQDAAATRIELARAALIEMGRADQQVRAGLSVRSLADTARLRQMMQVDSIHTERLRGIVRDYGWPGKSVFGEPAAQAAFLVVQHSPSHEFQQEMLELLAAAAEAGEARRADVAMLTDRVRTNAGQPQLYGTQFQIRDGRLVAHPIEDPAGLDARRAAMGLAPMAEYVARLRETYDGPVDSVPSAPPRENPLGVSR